MKTAKEILFKKAQKYNDGFLSGQIKWILEAMEEYADQRVEEYEKMLLELTPKELVEKLRQSYGYEKSFSETF